MKTGRNYKFWFCTGSQDLYGDENFKIFLPILPVVKSLSMKYLLYLNSLCP